MNNFPFLPGLISSLPAKLIPAAIVSASVFLLSPAHALLTNGDFSSGLSWWKSVGSVSSSDGAAHLSEGSEAPEVYQAVAVDGYVYELRFNFDMTGLSADAGSGDLDTAQILLYGGTDAENLDADSAAEVRVLVEVSSGGVTAMAPNASALPNIALGEGWYSAVVDFSSDFPAIAVAASVLNNNTLSDSSFSLAAVELVNVDRGRLANISNRGSVGTGVNIMIPGFAIGGTTPKTLLIRGVGPTLGGFGVGGTIVDPAIGLFPSGELTPIQSNDNWEDTNDLNALKAAFGLVGAFDLTEGSKDAAMLVQDLAPGAYTVKVSGVSDVTGVALAEVYDLGALLDGPTEVVNISNRGFIGVDAQVQIPGFVIRGDRGKKVLIRSVGPTLEGFGVAGVLADPTLELFRQGEQAPFFTNDDWEAAFNARQIEVTAASVGAFPLLKGAEGKDAAVLIALPPGSYSAVARGKDGLTGVALVEVYMVTENQRPTAANNLVYVTTGAANVLPNDVILGNDDDPDEDILTVGLYTQPKNGSVTLDDEGELVYTAPEGFFGEAVFSYRASDGEYESVPATIALQVTPADVAVWTGGSSGNFTDPANWLGGEVPGATDAVWIAPAGDTTITIDADITVGSIRAGGTGANVTLKISGRTLTVPGGLDIRPGSVLELSDGSLNTTEDAVIRGRLVWSGGEMTGSGTTLIADGASASLTGASLYLRTGRNFTNSGTLTQTGNATIVADSLGETSTITNASSGQWTVDVNAGGRVAYAGHNLATLNFVNAGSLAKSGTDLAYLGSSGGTFNLTNTGSLAVDAGTLQLESAGGNHTLSGSLSQSAGAVFEIRGGTATLLSEVTFTGAGDVLLSAGTLLADQGASVGNLKQTGGSLSGTATLTLTGTFAWSGGEMNGSGTTLIADGASASLTGASLYLRTGRSFTNNGTLTQTGNATIVADTSGGTSTITNASTGQWTVDVNTGVRVAYADHNLATLNFVNAGILTKSGTGLAYLGSSVGAFNLTNTGSLEVEGGVLRLEGTSAAFNASGTLRLTTNASTTPLVRAGGLSFAGGLEILAASGYTPSGTIRLIDFTSNSGVFDLPLGAPTGFTATPTYVASGLNITFTAVP